MNWFISTRTNKWNSIRIFFYQESIWLSIAKKNKDVANTENNATSTKSQLIAVREIVTSTYLY